MQKKAQNNNKHRLVKLGLPILIFLMFFSVLGITSSAAIQDDYAPILYFEGEENCYPVDANYHIDNSDLFKAGDANPVEVLLSATLVGSYSSDTYQYHYLDNLEGTVENQDVISHYTARDTDLYPDTVYYRIKYETGATVVQYWMFYSFNKGDLNQHEGDWEMVQVVIPDAGSKWVAYSQHETGQRASWDLVEKDGTNIKVYVARGSHANYLRSYSGRLGLASDHVGDNGEVWKPGSYELVDMVTQDWITFRGMWGEVPLDIEEDAITSAIFGEIGPYGPMYRQNSEMWNDPVVWGESLAEANSTFFLIEWFLANFVLIFIIITLLSVALTLFLIYRRHKKHGLGPRIVSMLYIDGLNLKSIGNILCFIAIIIVVIGLFQPWYGVSYSVEGADIPESLKTEGMVDAISIDGINGIQMVIPGLTGSTPVGVLLIPFSLIIIIGFLFMVLASVGLYLSRKLGYKYIKRGIAVLLPIIFIILIIFAMGQFVPDDVGGSTAAGESMSDVIKSITSSPFGGDKSVTVIESGITGKVDFSWGLKSGGQMLFLGGIMLIAAGIIEIFANKQFFEPKNPELMKKRLFRKSKKASPAQQQEMQAQAFPTQYEEQQPQETNAETPPVPPPEQPVEPEPEKPVEPEAEKTVEEKKLEKNFCPKCGTKIAGETVFCPECGKKIK